MKQPDIASCKNRIFEFQMPVHLTSVSQSFAGINASDTPVTLIMSTFWSQSWCFSIVILMMKSKFPMKKECLGTTSSSWSALHIFSTKLITRFFVRNFFQMLFFTTVTPFAKHRTWPWFMFCTRLWIFFRRNLDIGCFLTSPVAFLWWLPFLTHETFFRSACLRTEQFVQVGGGYLIDYRRLL